MPDPELLTRDELLLAAERRSLPGVTDTALRHWERQGFLPRARRDGAPGRQQAHYPWWSVDLLALLRHYQQIPGLTPKQIRERLRADAFRLSLFRNARDIRDERATLDAARFLTDGPRPPAFARLGDLGSLLSDLVVLHRDHLGVPVIALDLVLTTEAGERITYSVYPPLAAPGEGVE